MKKLNVLIVDNAVLYRKMLAEAVIQTGLGEVKHSVPNEQLALEWLKHDSIDVVLLNSFIAGLNSIELLKSIKEKYPHVEIVLLSENDKKSAMVTINALEFGAIDFILKPQDISSVNIDQMAKRLHMLFTQIKVSRVSPIVQRCTFASPVHKDSHFLMPSEPKCKSTENNISNTKPEIVLIASSTGGPAALEKVLSGIGSDFPCPILVVQHMPPEFTRIMAQTLDRKCQLKVYEGKREDVVRSGEIVIAPGGLHMELKRQNKGECLVDLNSHAYVNGVRPAADVLFSSVARAYEDRSVLSVVLTGMGNDGTEGVAELKRKCNCYCITQSERTCVVYGMPRSIKEAGLSDEVVDLEMIAERICQIAGDRS